MYILIYIFFVIGTFLLWTLGIFEGIANCLKRLKKK